MPGPAVIDTGFQARCEMRYQHTRGALRRRVMSAAAVLIVAAGAGYDIKTAPPPYADGATVIFSAAGRLAHFVGEPNFDQSLIITEVMLAQTMSGHVRTADGTTQLQSLPCNRSDLEYPDYAEQCATLTAIAPGAAAARQALALAYRMLSGRLAALQSEFRVISRNRIHTSLVGMSGPLPQQGSKARVLAGLALLTLMAVLTVSRFAAYHGPARRGGKAGRTQHRRGVRRRSGERAVSRGWRRGEVS